MLRLAFLIGLLAACGGTAKGPAWPKSATDGPDGGESIAPRKTSPLAANDTSDDSDSITIETPTEKPAVKATPDDAKPEAPRPSAPTTTAPDDILNVDDLVIEIDD